MRFTYSDYVTVRSDAPIKFRPGTQGSIIAVFEDRESLPFPDFPAGTVYMIEFEGGDAIDIHESMLEEFEA